MIKRTIEVEIEIGSVEVKNEEEDEDPITPKKVVLGYSQGDEIRVAGRDHTVQSVNYTRGFEDDPPTFSVFTEEGLSIKGSAGDVMGIIEG